MGGAQALTLLVVVAALFFVPAGLLGRVSARTGTPVTATLAGGLVATATTLAALAVAGDDNSRYFSVALTLSISLLALAAALWPGLGTADPDAYLPDGFAGQRLAFTLAELLLMAAVLAAAFLLARHRRSG